LYITIGVLQKSNRAPMLPLIFCSVSPQTRGERVM
jgi:hypothetical protein